MSCVNKIFYSLNNNNNFKSVVVGIYAQLWLFAYVNDIKVWLKFYRILQKMITDRFDQGTPHTVKT